MTSVFVALALAAAGCTSKVAASNPFDPATPLDQQAKGTVTGKVVLEVVAAAPTPGRGALITLDDGHSGIANADGSFVIDQTTPGTRFLTVTLTGYHDAAETHVFHMDAGGSVSLPDTVLLQLDRGSILGTVVASDGKALEGGTVFLAGTQFEVALVPSLAGPSAGSFSFTDIPIGTYQVVARAKGYAVGSGGTVTVTRAGVINVSPINLAPSSGDFGIADGDPTHDPGYTRFTDVTLQLHFAGAAGVRASEDETFGGGAQPFVPYPSGGNLPFVLGSASGAHSIFVQTKDASGIPSSLYSASIVALHAAPTGTLAVGNGRPYQAGLAFSAQVTGSAYVSQSALALDQSGFACTAASYAPFAAVQPVVFSGQGQHTVAVCLRDQAGNVSTTPLTAQIFADTAAPIAGGISIQGYYADGTPFPSQNSLTGTQTVTLNLSPSDAGGSGVAQMRLTNATGFTTEAWQPFAPSATWTLPQGDGPKTVRAQFMDASGQVSASDATGTITLHAAPPSASSLVVAGGVTPLSNPVPSVVATATGAVEVALSVDGAPAAPSWQPLPVSTLGLGVDGFHVVLARFRSDTHVEGPTATASLTLKTTPPVASAFALQGTLGSGALSQTLTQSVSVSALFSNLSADTVAIQLVEPPPAGSCGPTLFHNTGPWEQVSPVLTFTLRAGDGAHTVCAAFKDAAGNVSWSAAGGITSAAITLDTTPPSNPSFVNIASGFTNQNTTPAGGAMPQVTFVSDNVAPTPTYQCLGGQFTAWTDCQPSSLTAPVQLPQAFTLEPAGATAAADGTYTLGVRARDDAYNFSQGSFITVTRLTVPPQPPTFTAAIPTPNSVRLQWTASTSNNVVNYLINYGNTTGAINGTGSLQGPSPVSAGSTTSYMLSGLSQNTPYYISIVAVDAAGNQSPPSLEKLVVTNEVNPRLLASFGARMGDLVALLGNNLYVAAPEGMTEFGVGSDAGAPVVRRAVIPNLLPSQPVRPPYDGNTPAPAARVAVAPCVYNTSPGNCAYVPGLAMGGGRAQMGIVFFPQSGASGLTIGALPDRGEAATIVNTTTQGPLLATLSSSAISLYSINNPAFPTLLKTLPLNLMLTEIMLAAFGSSGNTLYALVYENDFKLGQAHLVAVPDVTAIGAAAKDLGRFTDTTGASTIDDSWRGNNLGPIPVFASNGLYLFWQSLAAAGTRTFNVSRYQPLSSMAAGATLQLGAPPVNGAQATSVSLVNNHLYLTARLSGTVTQVTLDGSGNPASVATLLSLPDEIASVAGLTGASGAAQEHYYSVGEGSLSRWTGGAGSLTALPAGTQFNDVPASQSPLASWNGFLFVGSFSFSPALHSIWTLDLANPTAGQIVSKFTSTARTAAGPTGNGFTRLKVMGNLLFAAANDPAGGVDILRINSNGSLTYLSTAAGGTAVADLAVNTRYLFCATPSGILSFDVLNPSAPAASTTYGAGKAFAAVDATRAFVYGADTSATPATLDAFALGNGTATASPALSNLTTPIAVSYAAGSIFVSDAAGTIRYSLGTPSSPNIYANRVYPVSGPVVAHGGYLFGPSPYTSSDGVRAVNLYSGQIRGAMPYVACRASSGARPGFVEVAGGFAAQCDGSSGDSAQLGIQLTSQLNLFAGNELWQAAVGQSTASAFATDGSSLLFSGIGITTAQQQAVWLGGEDYLSYPLYPSPSATGIATAGQPTALYLQPGVLVSVETNSVGAIMVRAYDPSTSALLGSLTLGGSYPSYPGIAFDGSFLYVQDYATATSTDQVEIVDLREPTAPAIVNTIAGVRPPLVLGRNRLYANAVAGGIGIWDTTTPATASSNPLTSIPYTIVTNSLPSNGGMALVAGSSLLISQPNQSSLLVVQLSTALDGTGLTAASTNTFPLGQSINAFAVSGDALIGQSKGSLAIFDLGPWQHSGLAPALTGGQQLAESVSVTNPNLRLDGPFAWLDAYGLPPRLFDLR